MGLGIFKIARPLKKSACFHVTVIENFERFQYFTLKQIFWKRKFFLKKLEYCLFVESTKIENPSFPYKTAISETNFQMNIMMSKKMDLSQRTEFYQ